METQKGKRFSPLYESSVSRSGGLLAHVNPYISSRRNVLSADQFDHTRAGARFNSCRYGSFPNRPSGRSCQPTIIHRSSVRWYNHRVWLRRSYAPASARYQALAIRTRPGRPYRRGCTQTVVHQPTAPTGECEAGCHSSATRRNIRLFLLLISCLPLLV